MAFKKSTIGALQNSAYHGMLPVVPMATPPSNELAKSSYMKIEKATKVRSTTNGTDAVRHGGSPQARVPLNIRNMRHGTEWPLENMARDAWEPAANRIYGNGLFRRYPSGQIDVKYASYVVEQALRKSYMGIPLTENEALACSAVFPDMKFQDVTPSMVTRKAPLSKSESSAIRCSVTQETADILRALGLDPEG